MCLCPAANLIFVRAQPYVTYGSAVRDKDKYVVFRQNRNFKTFRLPEMFPTVRSNVIW